MLGEMLRSFLRISVNCVCLSTICDNIIILCKQVVEATLCTMQPYAACSRVIFRSFVSTHISTFVFYIWCGNSHFQFDIFFVLNFTIIRFKFSDLHFCVMWLLVYTCTCKMEKGFIVQTLYLWLLFILWSLSFSWLSI